MTSLGIRDLITENTKFISLSDLLVQKLMVSSQYVIILWLLAFQGEGVDTKSNSSIFAMYDISSALGLKSIYFSFLDELKKLQEQMKSLQEQLKIATITQPASPALLHKSPGNQTVILGITCISVSEKL